ncbi:871_t:CDS:10 [Funneliformis caledonium]|uniref:871_t:CDS:1 n=1 Tax=Funneliformis caledonium TaxID=1117310 RepID=A0A9N9GI51_9GLOM|nr:871_t:CDS:10 [Funneliformis caledonium]
MDDFYKPPYSSAASTIPPVPPHPASLGNVEVVKILMNANVNVECCNRENATSLIIAAYNGHADVCCEPTDHAQGASVHILNKKCVGCCWSMMQTDPYDVGHFDLANMIENNWNILSRSTRERFLTTIPQHPIEKNILIQNIYPEIPINNTKGYLMPLNRKDSRRIIQHDEKNHVKAAPHLTPSVLFSLAVTACFCNPCLFTIGKMKDPNVVKLGVKKLKELDMKETILILSNEDKLLGEDSVTEWLRGLLGKDATREILHTRRYQNVYINLKQETLKEQPSNSIMTVLFAGILNQIHFHIAFDCFEFPIPQSYLAIGEDGTPEERKGLKAGNRGKRDSQLILIKWLSNIFFNERMTPLEFELFEKVRTLTGVTPYK